MIDPAGEVAEGHADSSEPRTAKRSDLRGDSFSRLSRSSKRAQRYFPGDVVADRYRILNLAGRGGMGEVYHAEDARLTQDVALKFLPPELARRAESVERLVAEARLARLVTHPNVCRVHDVGDVEGQVFLSMEFIEGENLSTLLKRIGRLPGDKALAVAHQVCAGLAAAHDRGVVHRDLKPANVMLDAKGDAKIADFGLSGLAEQVGKPGIRAGTPAYMAPEQLRGKGASVRTDLYSLGLVLYEVFTGKPVFRPASLQELQELHESPIAEPSTLVSDIDPAVERAIMWCLEREPDRRPPDARAVALALPGGILDATLLAGRVPTPDEVAAAGGEARVRLIHALVMALGITLVFAVGVRFSHEGTIMGAVALPKPLDALTDRAKQVVENLGYDADPVDEAASFDRYEELLDEFARQDQSQDRWKKLRWTRPAAIDYWYRQRSAPMLTVGPDQRVTFYDPPAGLPGSVSLRLDPSGRLREFVAATEPPFYDAPAPENLLPDRPVPPDWAPVLKAAGLDVTRFAPTRPQRVCPIYADTIAAWEGVYPEKQDEKIRVEAAGFKGKVVYFRIVELNWIRASMPEELRPSGWKLLGASLKQALYYGAVLGAGGLAWRNVKLRRGDRAGALRVASIAFVASVARYLLAADHVPDFSATVTIAARSIYQAVPVAAMFWIFYLGVEPAVRRSWPEMLISWSRVVTGAWKDPLVGVNILAGTLGGAVVYVLAVLDNLSPAWIGEPRPVPFSLDASVVDSIGRTPVALAAVIAQAIEAMQRGLETVVAVVLLKMLLKRKDAAAVAFACLQAAAWDTTFGSTFISVFFWGLAAAITVFALVRYGFLALFVGMFVGRIMATFPIAMSAHDATARAGLIAFLFVGVFVVLGVGLAGFVRHARPVPASGGSGTGG